VAEQVDLAPVHIAYLLGLDPATVHHVLICCRLARLADLDRATGRTVRRYEHAAPGDLVHVDIKKLGNTPDGGDRNALDRQVGRKNRAGAVNTQRAPRAESAVANRPEGIRMEPAHRCRSRQPPGSAHLPHGDPLTPWG
jgi:hypothetical protein